MLPLLGELDLNSTKSKPPPAPTNDDESRYFYIMHRVADALQNFSISPGEDTPTLPPGYPNLSKLQASCNTGQNTFYLGSPFPDGETPEDTVTSLTTSLKETIDKLLSPTVREYYNNLLKILKHEMHCNEERIGWLHAIQAMLQIEGDTQVDDALKLSGRQYVEKDLNDKLHASFASSAPYRSASQGIFGKIFPPKLG